MIQTTVSLDGHILGSTREASSADRIEIVDWQQNPSSPLQVLIALETDTPREFSDLLEADETVRDHHHFGAVAGREQYVIEYADHVPDVRAYDSVIENTGLPHRCYTLGDGGWMVELSFPDRDALGAFSDHCADIGLPVDVHRVQTHSDEDSAAFGLTPRQQVALRTALNAGYFEYPQRATQADVADRLGVSRQATSELLHRGLRQLLAATIATPES
jgi:predicted DNA binding protein